MSRDFVIHLALLALLLVSTPARAASIAGRVIDNDSDAPVSAATISLLSGDDSIAETQSNGEGGFSFSNVVDGFYRLVASKTGYLSLLPSHISAAVVISDGKSPQPVRLTMTKTCAISGQVSDESGQPLRGIKVVAMVRRLLDGVTRLIEAGKAAYTNDQGSYRLYGLAPGSYTVAAVPDGELTGERVFSPLYFPATADRTRAAFFRMQPGEMRNQVDFRIDRMLGVKISGVISGIPSGWLKSKISVRLISTDGDPIQTVAADLDGRFLFSNVPSGSYRIVAWGPIFAWGDKGPTATPHGRAASSRVDAENSETTEVTLELRDLATVEGRVSLEESDRCSNGAQVSLHPLDPLPGADALAASLSHGTFSISDVPEGRYRLQLRALKGNCYLARVGLGDRSAENGIISVSGNSKVSLMLGTDGATISGRVTTPPGKAPAGVVLLIPEEAMELDDHARLASPNEEGQFQFDNVWPGAYRALALAKVDSLDVMDATFAAEHGAVRVVARPGDSITIEVTLYK